MPAESAYEALTENSDIVQQISEGDVDAETLVILWNMKRDVLAAGGNSGTKTPSASPAATSPAQENNSSDEDPANKLRAPYKEMNAQGIKTRPRSPPHAGGDSSVKIPPEQQRSINRWKAKDGPPVWNAQIARIATFAVS
jgi:hypothetical protein